MEEDSKKGGDDNDKNRGRVVEGSRVEAGVMPGAMKNKGTEGRTTGHRCSSGWEYMRERQREMLREKVKDRELVCLPWVQIPVSASLLVNFAPVGFMCGREKSADFVYQEGWQLSALCCCALVILGACLRQSDNKIWDPLGQSSLKLTLLLIDVSGEVSDVT